MVIIIDSVKTYSFDIFSSVQKYLLQISEKMFDDTTTVKIIKIVQQVSKIN